MARKRNKKGQFKPGDSGGPGRGKKKVESTLDDIEQQLSDGEITDSDLRLRAKAVLLKGMGDGDAKVSVRSADLIGKLLGADHTSSVASPFALRVMQLLNELRMNFLVNTDDLLTWMFSHCGSCPLLGAGNNDKEAK